MIGKRIGHIIGVALLAVFVGLLSPCWGNTMAPAPHLVTLKDGCRYGFPPHVEKRGLSFGEQRIPLEREDVRERILKEINYLLLDKRSLLLLWLTRSDALRPLVMRILRTYSSYGFPEEFLYLAGIESSYDSRARSSAGAYGYWQFIKPTAVSASGAPAELNWVMTVNHWKDERGDLVKSTHAAARYLIWLNRERRISLEGQPEQKGFNDWLLSAAAYNAGPGRIVERLNAYRATSYWDVALPPETEAYVPRLIALCLISSHRKFYGVDVERVTPLAFETVEKIRLKKDLSFASLAQLLGTTPRQIGWLNSQISPEKGVFPAQQERKPIEHTIHIPQGTKSRLLAGLRANGYTAK